MTKKSSAKKHALQNALRKNLSRRKQSPSVVSSKIKYHFFGKECVIDRQISDYSNLENCLKEINFEHKYQPLLVNQIHSSQVITIDDEKKIHRADQKPKADAIVTNIKGLPIAVITADCLPIFFIDEKNSIIAVAHAGWAGAKNNIIKSTVKAMVDIGAETKNIKAIIGPSIRQKSYEVSADFFSEFMNESGENEFFFIPSKKNGHYMFDLPAYCRGKIHLEGIQEIFDENIDTYSSPEKFFSYRRSTHLEEKDCGRNISIIMLA